VAQAFSTLQKENLSVPFPSWFYRIWRATHPSIGERIEFANSYRPWISGDPEVYAGKYNSSQMSK
jgi:Zn-dependent protease with chaperone function